MSKLISLTPSPRRIQWVASNKTMVGGWEGIYVDVSLCLRNKHLRPQTSQTEEGGTSGVGSG
jgi:hypothetical protein